MKKIAIVDLLTAKFLTGYFKFIDNNLFKKINDIKKTKCY